MITVEEILAPDLRCPPSQRSLPWPETRNGVTVVVEPKPHWAADMAAFRLQDRSWCYYADWIENDPAARFFDHPETSGSDVMTNAHAMLAREIAQGLWRM
ncbi:hypothetical protein FLX27_05935 [Agrobacterium tumefaciens]|nr:hypothetical protein [Agrobacterium tumefaciens]TQN62449.1 hypothetical protein FLX27_05935 [Agrobacterium tumefaciens]